MRFKFVPMLIHRLILFATGLCLVGCSQSRPEGVLTYWCASNSFEIEFAKQITAEWNSDTTRLPVRFQPIPAGRSSEEVMLAAIVAKTTPDVYSNVWPGVIEQYREAGAVLRLSDFSDFDSMLTSRLPEALIPSFRSPDREFYQVPWKSNPLMLVYNAGLLAELGIEKLPRTYSDLLALGPIIAVDLNGDQYPDRWVLNPNIVTVWWQRFFDFYVLFVAATEGQTLISQGRAQIDRVETYRLMSFFRENYIKGYFPRSIFQHDVFLSGQLAFNITGPWIISYLEKYKDEDFEYGVTTVPVFVESDAPVHTYGDPKSIVIFSTTKYPEAAWEFVKFFTNRANDLRLLKMTSQLPLRKNLDSDPLFSDFFKSNPKLLQFAQQIPYVAGTDHTIYLQEIFDIISQEFDAACIHQVKTVDEAVKSLQRRVTKLLERESLLTKQVGGDQ